jgi:hypothetical protein
MEHGRHHDVQCRPSGLNSLNLELGNLEQGKYEEEKRKKRGGKEREVGELK